MEVILVTGEYGKNGGGLSLSCYSYKEMLIKFGIKVHLISSVYNRDDNRGFYKDNFYIEDGGYNKALKNQLAFQAKLKEETKKYLKHCIDFVIAFGSSSNGIFANELSKELNSKLIVLTRGSDINLSLSDVSLRYMNEIVFSNASKIISLSNELSNNSQKISQSKQDKYHVIPLPINGCKQYNLNVQGKKVLIMGTGAKFLNEKKGVGNLIMMCYFLNNNDNQREYYLELVGKVDDDLKRNYQKLTTKYNLEKYVSFIGDLSREDFIFQMKKWDFYVQGSFCEAFSNSLIEYFAFGKPFIVTDTGFIPENIKGIAEELIFNSFKPSEMANDIITLLAKPTMKELYQKAYSHLFTICNKTDIENMWKEILFEDKTENDENSFVELNNIISLTLHDISEFEHSNIDTPEKIFKQFVERLVAAGYKLCSSKDYFNLQNKSKYIICTFDDGYEGVIKYALPILKEYNFTSTVFVCTDYIGKSNSWNYKDKTIRKHMNIDMLKELYSEGWEIASHGVTHRSLLRLSDQDLEIELSRSKTILSNYFGEISSYAYPYGDNNQYCINKVKKYYKYAYALDKGGTLEGVDNLQIKRYFISELNKIVK